MNATPAPYNYASDTMERSDQMMRAARGREREHSAAASPRGGSAAAGPGVRSRHTPWLGPLALALALLALLAPVAACHDDPPVVYPTIAPVDETKMPLGPGDKLELTIFFGARESKATYTLDASGQVDVQYIGSVHAGGKVVNNVKAEIVERLKDGYINDPIVSLTVVEVNSRKVSVLGQVARSGTIRFTPGMTIVEAIAQSGGFSPMARKNMVKVTRFLEGRKETYKIPVEMIGEGKRPNFPVMPGDEVFVPERAW
jgi:polysaccharide export outer membrane protein